MFTKNKKANGKAIVAGIIIMAVIAIIAVSCGVYYLSENTELFTISRLSGDYEEVRLEIMNPDVEEGQTLQVYYSLYNHGKESSVCGFIELLADDNLYDSRYFCLTNSNAHGRDATRLENVVNITGLKEGKHDLKVRYAIQRANADYDDEYLYKYRTCPDGDKNANGAKIDSNINDAFKDFVQYMPCEIKVMPSWRHEYEYDESLIDYALTINPDFAYEVEERKFFLASEGTFDAMREADELEQEKVGLEYQIDQLMEELQDSNLTNVEKLILEAEVEELQAQLDELTKPGVVEGMKLAGFSVGVILMFVFGVALFGIAGFIFFRR